MQAQSATKNLIKQYFSQKFHEQIDSMVYNITSQDERQLDVQDSLHSELQLPQHQELPFFPSQPKPASFQQLIQLYIANKTKQIDPIFDMFHIVQDIIGKYRKSITCERLQEINKQLYELAQEKQKSTIKSSKRLSTQGSDNSKSTSNIMDYYLLQIQQLNQRVRELQELLSARDQRIKELEFKVFSMERIRGDVKPAEEMILNPTCPKLQASLEMKSETEPRDLETIREDIGEIDDSSAQIESSSKIKGKIEMVSSKQVSMRQEEKGENASSRGGSYIKVQEGSQNISQIRRSVVSSPEILANFCKDVNQNSNDIQNNYNFQYQIHSLQVQTLKLQQELSKQQKQNLIQKEEIGMLKKEKEYYFKQLKTKQSELKKSSKIIDRLVGGEKKSKNL